MRYFVYCRKSSEAEDRQILSIESQQNELKRAFGGDPSITIVAEFQEAFSAKAPGRSVFDEMFKRIERGDAEGIIAWHPDRLARNSVDGGKIIWYLDRGLLKDLKFATYTFENNPQGKFMLSIFLGQSKYYVDSLSENIKRGNRTKIEKGWRPNHAPIGYLNCGETRTIIVDPERFRFVRRIFDLMLTGAYAPSRIQQLARDEWGLRTRKTKKLGGKPLTLSGIYRILSNPFYAGHLVWNGGVYAGKHVPIITFDEFELVQELLGRPRKARPHEKVFAFTGVMRCGACGLGVTAEEKTNRHGSKYTYYHCTKRNPNGHRCRQPVIQAAELEAQILQFLESVTLSKQQHGWTLDRMEELQLDVTAREQSGIAALESAHAEAVKSLDTLTSLRIREMLTDAEYVSKRTEIHQEILRSQSRLDAAKARIGRFEPLADFISFSSRALDWFRAGDAETKRLIFKTVGSNPCLLDKKLSVEARVPFVRISDVIDSTRLCTVVQDVLTLQGDPEWENTLANIRYVIKKCSPEHLQKAA